MRIAAWKLIALTLSTERPNFFLRLEYTCVSRRTGGDRMQQLWTAVISQDEGWWIGWIAEVPGVNAQERTRDELLESLAEVLREALEMNRRDAIANVGEYESVAVAI